LSLLLNWLALWSRDFALTWKRLLLIIDQFEEIYIAANAAERSRFLEDLGALGRTALPCSVLAILRADALEQILSLSAQSAGPFPALYNNYRQRLLGPMSYDSLRQAVRSHVEAAGLDLEGGLAERIVGDLYREAGSLPLLQVTLTQLFKQRVAQTLTHEAYNGLGTVHTVVANYAFEVLEKLASAEKLPKADIDQQSARFSSSLCSWTKAIKPRKGSVPFTQE
jgi:hypothetical protein